MRSILMVAVSALVILVASIIEVKKRQDADNFSLAVNGAGDINDNKNLVRLKNIAAYTKKYVLQHNYNASICFL